ncbi:DUF397 domain-containing protein [Nocardia blacklockiae]|uniref:DUF397 domain-containing protein n=1 Tax=Nocardia blacklockiae TaxID=480036 RepID=UPI002B4B706C|nr:DUF397 domain-containing protein [Nocardia blacklockiae]
MNAENLEWRVSSFSDNGTCVEVAGLPDGGVLIRNSNARDVGTLAFTRAEFSAWIRGCATGEFDDLV